MSNDPPTARKELSPLMKFKSMIYTLMCFAALAISVGAGWRPR